MNREDWTELNRRGPQTISIGGRPVSQGTRVRLRPRENGDVLMRALAGRRGIVEAVEHDLDGQVHLAVMLEEDPARDLGKGRGLGHRFFFDADEVEPLAEASDDVPPRILVAGIGNVFFGDDGFGVEVVRRLARTALPAGVAVVDFGIRGMDLAYALNDGYAAALLVDAAPLGQAAGTLEVIEPRIDGLAGAGVEAHGIDPAQVLALAAQLGRLPGRVLLVACEPQVVGDPDDPEILAGLSPAVDAAVDPATALVRSLIDQLLTSYQEARSA